MAAVKKPRGRVWENRETMLLLQKWGDENIQTKLLSCTRKKPIWQEISAFLRAAGYEDRDEDACKTRIHTLVSAYRSYKDECRKTGNETPKKKPAFFDEVRKALHEAKECRYFFPNLVIGDGTQVCEEESKGNVENVAPNLTSSSSDNNNKASKCPEPKKDACVTCTGELSKKNYRLLEGQTIVTRNGTWAPCTVDKVDGFIFANILPRQMESCIARDK